MLAALIVLGCAIANLIFPIAGYAAFVLCHVPIEEVTLFQGPGLFKGSIGRTAWIIRAIPSSSEVKPQEDSYRAMRRPVRMAIQLSAPLAIMIAGLLLTGCQAAPWHIAALLVQATLHPVTNGSHLLQAYRDGFHDHPAGMLGRFLIAIGWINLLPIPTSSGGRFIREVVGAALEQGGGLERPWAWLSLAGALALVASWIAAYVYA